jgi:tRNA dimethylallyltransferase
MYKHLQIGTAKPTAAEMQGIPHYMIDVIEPHVQLNSMDFAMVVREQIMVRQAQLQQ